MIVSCIERLNWFCDAITSSVENLDEFRSVMNDFTNTSLHYTGSGSELPS